MLPISMTKEAAAVALRHDELPNVNAKDSAVGIDGQKGPGWCSIPVLRSHCCMSRNRFGSRYASSAAASK